MTLLDEIGEGALVALDTAPWIYHFECDPSFASVVGPLFEAIDSGVIRAGASVLVLGEILVKPISIGRADLVGKYRALMTDSPGLALWDVTRAIVEAAAELRARYRVAMIDALHLATAITAGADVFLTNDRRLRRVAEIRVLTMAPYPDAPPSVAIPPELPDRPRLSPDEPTG